MMIREFLGRVERLEKVAAEQRRLRGLLGWERAVSYTHLTLPTNREV